MRRNFTQMFMSMALLVGFSTMAHAQCDEPIPAPEGSIYNWQFDGGLEGWRATNSMDEDVDHTSTLPGSADGTVFGWVWDAEGFVGGGAYNPDDGENDFIISPSVCNGAMVFNADFYDNAGVPGDFGFGVCPNGEAGMFCEGWLKSPPIDLSAVDNDVILSFNQGLRQFTSEYFVFISVDGGISYKDTIQFNADIETNSQHLLDERLEIPLCGFSGEPDVRIDFLYRGSYYYWSIDDVTITPASGNSDLRVNENFAAITTTWGTPKNMGHDLPFLVDIENVSPILGIAPTVTVDVLNEAGDVLHTQTRQYVDVPGCSTNENKVFPELYTQPDAEGTYAVQYSINEESDDNADNDVLEGAFRMTNNIFAKMPTEEEVGQNYLSGASFTGEVFQSWGAYYYMPHNDMDQAIERLRFGVNVTADDGNLAIGELVAGIYQWVDINNNGICEGGDNDEKIKIGEGTILTPEIENPRDFFIEITDADGNPVIPQPIGDPEDGIELLVMVHNSPFTAELSYNGLGLFDDEGISFNPGPSQFAYTVFDSTFQEIPNRYGSFFGLGASIDDFDTREFRQVGNFTFAISAELTPLTSTEEINENLGVSIFPSPASEIVNVDIQLEEVSPKVSIEMVNMSGAVVGQYNYSNIKNDVLSVDVRDLPGGMYLMNIRTEEGMISKKISVIH